MKNQRIETFSGVFESVGCSSSSSSASSLPTMSRVIFGRLEGGVASTFSLFPTISSTAWTGVKNEGSIFNDVGCLVVVVVVVVVVDDGRLRRRHLRIQKVIAACLTRKIIIIFRCLEVILLCRHLEFLFDFTLSRTSNKFSNLSLSCLSSSHQQLSFLFPYFFRLIS